MLLKVIQLSITLGITMKKTILPDMKLTDNLPEELKLIQEAAIIDFYKSRMPFWTRLSVTYLDEDGKEIGDGDIGGTIESVVSVDSGDILFVFSTGDRLLMNTEDYLAQKRLQ
jgi:hypothetical protein